jgi:hypothetical protein
MFQKNAELFWKSVYGTDFDSCQETELKDETVKDSIVFRFEKNGDKSFVIGTQNLNSSQFLWRMATDKEVSFIVNDIIKSDSEGECFS